jgi:hypothetical protein
MDRSFCRYERWMLHLSLDSITKIALVLLPRFLQRTQAMF